jgi:hypothetical protein
VGNFLQILGCRLPFWVLLAPSVYISPSSKASYHPFVSFTKEDLGIIDKSEEKKNVINENRNESELKIISSRRFLH